MSCLTSMIEPLRAANEISGSDTFSWRIVAEEMEKVPSSALVDFEPNCALADAGDLDLLILLSSPTAQFRSAKTIGRLRTMQRHGLRFGAVSGGVFLLVRAGLAADTPLSVHWCYSAAFAAEFPDHLSSDKLIETTKTYVTASGAAAAFDVSLNLIEEQLGSGIATEVACWFQHPVIRREGVSQAIPSLEGGEQGEKMPPVVARAAHMFAHNLADPISIGAAADHLAVSPRHLERAFKQATGLSPTHYYRKLRMDAARQIVLYTNNRIADIADAVGYGCAQTFGKHYRSAFGASPREDRNKINLFRVKGNLPVPSM